MKFTNIDHIFFDLDHTLWDFDKNSGLAFEAIFNEEKIDIALNEFLKTYVPINMGYWERYRKNKISKEDLRLGRLRDSFENLRVPVEEEVLERLSHKYIQFLPTFKHLLEDAVDVLDYLQPNYTLHIITNGFEEVQHTKMANSMINHYFSSVTTSEEAGVKKPHSLIFEMALEKAGATAEKSLMIGDNFEADIMGAKEAGMQALFFDYYKKQEKKDQFQIQKLKELRKYL